MLTATPANLSGIASIEKIAPVDPTMLAVETPFPDLWASHKQADGPLI